MTTESAPQPGVELQKPDAAAYLDAIDREVRLARIVNNPVVLTWWLLAVNVIIWVVAVFYGDTLGITSRYFNNEQLVLYTGMKVNDLVASGQWWRLISSQFVHLDIMHILFNGYGLYVLGPMIERFYGWRRFLLLYLASGTVGALASFFFTDIASGGASGAIYGLVGALLVFGFKYRDQLPKRVSKALTVGMLPWVVLSIGIGFMESLPMDNAAHLGGLFSGGFFVLLMRSRLRRRASVLTNALIWMLTGAACAALVWTMATWSQEVWQCTGSKSTYFECYPKLEQQLDDLEQKADKR